MFHLELSVDSDRRFSSGFSPADYFRPFSVFDHQNPSQNLSFPLENARQKIRDEFVAKSLPLGRKMPSQSPDKSTLLQFHSAETRAPNSFTQETTRKIRLQFRKEKSAKNLFCHRSALLRIRRPSSTFARMIRNLNRVK